MKLDNRIFRWWKEVRGIGGTIDILQLVPCPTPYRKEDFVPCEFTHMALE
jgi:hypothetical protein